MCLYGVLHAALNKYCWVVPHGISVHRRAITAVILTSWWTPSLEVLILAGMLRLRVQSLRVTQEHGCILVYREQVRLLVLFVVCWFRSLGVFACPLMFVDTVDASHIVNEPQVCFGDFLKMLYLQVDDFCMVHGVLIVAALRLKLRKRASGQTGVPDLAPVPAGFGIFRR
jgi:hypothetical protein